MPASFMAGMRVAYIQTHMTSVQQTSTSTGARKSVVVGTVSPPGVGGGWRGG